MGHETDNPELLPLPLLKREDLEQLSKPQLIEIVLLLQEQNRILREQVRKLEARVEELERRLNEHSGTSSKPPSSDPPWAKLKRKKKEKSGRKPGGQPGHDGHRRELLPPEKVDELQQITPKRCSCCGKALHGKDPAPKRYQWSELPATIKPTVHEVQLHTLRCQNCGASNTPDLPPGTPTGAFGPRVQAMVAVLTGVYRLSKRKVVYLMQDFFHLQICLGSVSACEAAVSDAVSEPVGEAHQYVQKSSVLNADETGWWQRHLRSWLWVAATPMVVVFLVQWRRNSDAAKELLGKFAGVLVSDRWSGYDYFKGRRQQCWAHLRRYFEAFSELPGGPGRIGKELLGNVRIMFKWWHQVRDGTLTRAVFIVRMEQIQKDIEALLSKGERCGHSRMSKTCRKILAVSEHLWTFVTEDGVEPTNNFAERMLRHAVIWRKISFGTHSEEGSRFVERVLTVTATCWLQSRNPLDYIAEACRAKLFNLSAPSLLPQSR